MFKGADELEIVKRASRHYSRMLELLKQTSKATATENALAGQSELMLEDWYLIAAQERVQL